jgi:dolichyl-phosphate beta-glucosyltransferase
VKGSERSGKWESIRRGIIAAKGEYVAFMDVDMSVPATEASRLLGILQENGLDIVISSRYVGGSLVAQRQPLARIVFSRVFNRWVRLVFGMPYKDTQCGFKAFRAGIARRVASSMRCRGFEGDVEFLWLARKLGASVREEPVLWRDSETSSFRLRKGFGILFNLLKVRFWWHRGQETL